MVVWRWNIIRTAPCRVAYNSYAQWYAHRYEQLLNLSLARVRLVLLVFFVRFYVVFYGVFVLA